ncbi:MAG: class I SAM-dependent methyltransferase [Armatimonadetes bacterium]|nr:class I SAM-dependent methyltransferase [Armatimonadota bacterium]
MHFTEYWAIVERDHAFQNPTTPEKLMRLADYCQVRDGARVLDVGSGKGWLLRHWAKEWRIQGTGLEINPWFVEEARSRAAAEGVAERLTFIEGPALTFEPEPAGCDIVTCIGASFALGTTEEALDWMRRAVKPEGVLALGEVFLHRAPLPPDVLEYAGDDVPTSRDLAETVAAIEARGLELTGFTAASVDDWDGYESLHWRAAREWARENPDHPGRDVVLERVRRGREGYFRWERECLGWGIFVARIA